VTATFDRFCEELGGAYYPSPNVDEAFAQFRLFMTQSRHRALLHIRAFSPLAGRYRLENGWIRDGGLNAVAGIEPIDEIDCIGINVGTAYLFSNLFRAMLGHPRILMATGNSAKEVFRNPYNPEVLEIDLNNHRFLVRPNDPQRARFAYQLTYCAFHFVFLHEFAHLFHGHIDWLSENLGFRRLGETGASAIPGLSPIDLQTLEMDADAFGVIDLLTAALGVNYDHADRSKPPTIPERYVFGTRANAIFTVMFAVYSVLRLFGGEGLEDDVSVFRADHPPAVYRQRFILGSIEAFIQDLNIVSLPDFAEIFVNATVEAEEAFSMLSKNSPLAAPQMNEGFERGRVLLNLLLDNWKKLRPDLDRLKRGGDLHE
jgi:hypothetical protein